MFAVVPGRAGDELLQLVVVRQSNLRRHRLLDTERGSTLTDRSHIAPTILAAFLASLIEFIEALTVVLAVGAVRGCSRL